MATADKHVCEDCFEDPGIRDFIKRNAIGISCSFCDSSAHDISTTELDQVLEYMTCCLFDEYDDAVDWTYLDSDTKEPMNISYDAWDVLELVGLELPNDDDGCLFDAITYGLSDWRWSEANPFGITRQDDVRTNWESFCNVVKYHRRFFFEDYDDIDAFDGSSPRQMLEKIFDFAISIGSIVCLPKGNVVFRSRKEDPCKLISSARELGPPPAARATKPNRMSPPGIPMFYACDDIETALGETAETYGMYAVGCFRFCRPVKVLDLSREFPVPSVFERCPRQGGIRPRDAFIFLNHVVAELSKPVAKNDNAHIDYVPTQVVTEYVRSMQSDDAQIDGIKYRSAVASGRTSYVFFDGDVFIPDATDGVHVGLENGWLELTNVTHHYVF